MKALVAPLVLGIAVLSAGASLAAIDVTTTPVLLAQSSDDGEEPLDCACVTDEHVA